MARLAEDATLTPRNDDRDVGKLFTGGLLVLLHGAEEVLDGEEGAAHVDGVGAVPELGGHVPYAVGARLVCDTGVGAEDVNGAEVGDGIGDGLRD